MVIKSLKPFLLANLDIVRRINLFKEFYFLIVYMQKRLRNGVESRKAKVEVLIIYWDKMIN